jgi:hypothetical protein
MKTYDIYMSYTGKRSTVDGRTLSRMKLMMSELLYQGFDPEELFIEISSSDEPFTVVTWYPSDDGDIRHKIVTDITALI